MNLPTILYLVPYPASAFLVGDRCDGHDPRSSSADPTVATRAQWLVAGSQAC